MSAVNPNAPSWNGPKSTPSGGEEPPPTHPAKVELDSCQETTINICSPIVERELPANGIRFLTRVEALAPRWVPTEGETVLLACNPVDDVALVALAQIEIVQDWYLQGLVRGDIASVVSLAPAEEVAVRVSRTQRTKLDSSTVESNESMQSFEARISDKEILDVARAVTKNEQWQVEATGSVSAGPTASVEVSAGYQQSVSNQTSARTQQIRDATQTASNELRTISKVEVSSSRSTEVSTDSIRKISNPYRDRSLNLTVFELNKVYCVSTAVDQVLPMLAFRLPSIRFDRDFVLRNVDFLGGALVDRALAEELANALELMSRPDELVDIDAELDRLAARALSHLYVEHDVHFRSDPGLLDHTDEPAYTFDTGVRPSGWEDSRDKDFVNELYMLLGSFRKLANDAGFLIPRADDDVSRFTRLDLVLALAKTTKPLWSQISSGHKANIFDTSHLTGAFRRVPAFLALVDRIIAPRLQQRQQGNAGQSQRANLVLSRVLAHLECFREYYTERFHEYLYDVSHRTAHIEMVRDAVLDKLDMSEADRAFFFEAFDVESLVLAKTDLLVPARGSDASHILEKWFPEDDLGRDHPVARDHVVVPADGVSVEPSAGSCVLVGVPAPLPSNGEG